MNIQVYSADFVDLKRKFHCPWFGRATMNNAESIAKHQGAKSLADERRCKYVKLTGDVPVAR